MAVLAQMIKGVFRLCPEPCNSNSKDRCRHDHLLAFMPLVVLGTMWYFREASRLVVNGWLLCSYNACAYSADTNQRTM